jgi:hypothetical protein
VALTVQDWQNRVFYEVSGPLPLGPSGEPVRAQLLAALQAELPTLWEMASLDASMATTGGAWFLRLQFLYAKLAACDVLLGQLSSKVDSMLGRVLRRSYSQAFKQLKQLRDDAQKAITTLEGRVRLGRGAVSAAILQTAPVMTGVRVPAVTPPASQPSIQPDGFPDPNDLRYLGWPLESLNLETWR